MGWVETMGTVKGCPNASLMLAAALGLACRAPAHHAKTFSCPPPSPASVAVGTPIGGTGPVALTAYDPLGRWIVYREATRDTTGDGAIEASYGDHGEEYGDKMESYLAVGAAPSRTIQRFHTSSDSGRYVVIEARQKLQLVDVESDHEINLSERGAARYASGEPAVSFQGDKRLLYMRKEANRQATFVLLDLETSSEKEIATDATVVLGASLSATGDWIAMRSVERDTDKNGVREAPEHNVISSPHPCSTLTLRKTEYVGGDEVRERYASTQPQGATSILLRCASESRDGLVGLDEAGALVSVATDGTTRELLPPSCQPTLEAVDYRSGHVLASCASDRGSADPLFLVRDGEAQNLRLELPPRPTWLEPTAPIIVSGDDPPVVALSVDEGFAYIDLESGRISSVCEQYEVRGGKVIDACAARPTPPPRFPCAFWTGDACRNLSPSPVVAAANDGRFVTVAEKRPWGNYNRGPFQWRRLSSPPKTEDATSVLPPCQGSNGPACVLADSRAHVWRALVEGEVRILSSRLSRSGSHRDLSVLRHERWALVRRPETASIEALSMEGELYWAEGSELWSFQGISRRMATAPGPIEALVSTPSGEVWLRLNDERLFVFAEDTLVEVAPPPQMKSKRQLHRREDGRPVLTDGSERGYAWSGKTWTSVSVPPSYRVDGHWIDGSGWEWLISFADLWKRAPGRDWEKLWEERKAVVTGRYQARGDETWLLYSGEFKGHMRSGLVVVVSAGRVSVRETTLSVEAIFDWKNGQVIVVTPSVLLRVPKSGLEALLFGQPDESRADD